MNDLGSRCSAPWGWLSTLARTGERARDHASLADAYNDLGRYGEAHGLARQALAGYERIKFDEDVPVGGAQVALGRALTGLKRYPEAEAALIKAEQLL